MGYKNLEKYYNVSDVFVFASKIEGMPNVVIETMSMGLAFILKEIEDFSEV